MARRVILSVGTKRGLFLVESNTRRKRWKIEGPFLKGWAVHYAMIDTRGKPRIHATGEHYAHGSTLFSGAISGKNLRACENPPAAPPMNEKAEDFSNQYGLDKTSRYWMIEPGPKRRKKVLYAGSAPAGLFRSEDTGKTWEPVKGLNEHPSKKDWSPGAGGMSCHSIVQDPHDDDRMYVGISAAGAFRTDDGGENWKPINDCVAGYVGAPEESLVGT